MSLKRKFYLSLPYLPPAILETLNKNVEAEAAERVIIRCRGVGVPRDLWEIDPVTAEWRRI